LRRYRPENSGALPAAFVVTQPPGATVDSLAAALGIPDGFVSAAAVNDEAVDSATPLRDGDRVSLFPPSAGGRDALVA
jgi:molybdopterin converting factor small subunit